MRPSPDLEERDSFNFWAIARLIQGSTLQAAAANMESIALSLEQRYPETNRNRRVRMDALQDHLSGQVRPALLILMAAVGSLLLITCANIASLLLARAESRRREMAVREALGASRGRLLRQTLTESVLLAAIGAAAGLGLAWAGTGLAVRLAPSNIPRIQQTGLDLAVLLFTSAVALVAGILFGLVPALLGARGQVGRSLKEAGTRSSSAPANFAVRHMLVGGQMALAMMMLISAGLLVRSFLNVVRLDPGFQTAQVRSGYVNLAMPRYSDPQKQVAFFEEALRRIRALPGVMSAAASSSVPLTEINDTGSVRIETDPKSGERPPSANRPHVSADYFETMGIPIVQGRSFDSRDRADASPVAIVSDLAARQFWPNESPIGKLISINSVAGKWVWREVVGVVPSTRHFGLEAPQKPEVYVVHSQAPSSFMILVVRAQGNAGDVLGECRREIAAIDPQQAVMQGGSLEELVSNAQARRRFQSALLSAFAIVAALLAALGIYGVTAYTVTRRAREIGTRLALGALPRDVVMMIARTGSRTIVIGAFVGLAGAAALSRILASLLFGVSALDAGTFAGVALLLALVAGLSLYLPSRRAAAVDPVVVLREE
jgi:putative ABC transport system permease protein